MHSTSTPAVQGTPENQRTAAIGADESARPKSWSYMHRVKWAGGLPVPAAVQRTAICIVDHINEKTGRWKVSSAQMADETNQCERTIRSHVKMLRPYIQVEDRPGLKWGFTIPAPMMAVVEPRQPLPGTPATVADVPCDLPSNVHTSGRERLTCEKHSRSWPSSWGTGCYECAQERVARPERAAEPPERPQRTRRRQSDSGIRTGIIDAERRAARRAERGESWA